MPKVRELRRVYVSNSSTALCSLFVLRIQRRRGNFFFRASMTAFMCARLNHNIKKTNALLEPASMTIRTMLDYTLLYGIDARISTGAHAKASKAIFHSLKIKSLYKFRFALLTHWIIIPLSFLTMGPSLRRELALKKSQCLIRSSWT